MHACLFFICCSENSVVKVVKKFLQASLGREKLLNYFRLRNLNYLIHKILWIKNKQKKDFTEVKPLLMDLFDCMFCDPHGARTHDPNIKSVVLYQLS